MRGPRGHHRIGIGAGHDGEETDVPDLHATDSDATKTTFAHVTAIEPEATGPRKQQIVPLLARPRATNCEHALTANGLDK